MQRFEPRKVYSLGPTRYYDFGNFTYPSVTSILSATSSFDRESWENYVGKKEADEILRTALDRGNDLHAGIETYLTTGERPGFANPFAQFQFGAMVPFLNRITDPHCEIPLYSHKLKAAGTSDCIGYYDGVPSIIDFKNSRKRKTLEKITDYLIQATMYAIMANEMYQFKAEQIVIMVAYEAWPKPDIFIQPSTKHIRKALERLKKYYANC